MTNRPSDTGLALLADLHPTQITVGFREVAYKRLQLRSRIHRAKGAPKVVVPICLGPGGALYLIDGHHLACAMRDEGLREVHIRQIADFSALASKALWPALEARGWCRPFDAEGRRRPFGDIPHSLDGLHDDPFRSLASALRRAGGFTKGASPFSEFAWADFLRDRISSDAIVVDFDGSLDRALTLAGTPAARRLPGWRHDRATRGGVSPPCAPPHAHQ